MGPRSDSSPPSASPQATLFLMQLPDLPLVSACPSSHLTASVYPGPSVILTLSDPNSSGLLSSRSAHAYTFRSPQSLRHRSPLHPTLGSAPLPQCKSCQKLLTICWLKVKGFRNHHLPWVLPSPPPNTNSMSTFVQPSNLSMSLKPRSHSLQFSHLLSHTLRSSGGCPFSSPQQSLPPLKHKCLMVGHSFLLSLISHLFVSSPEDKNTVLWGLVLH